MYTSVHFIVECVANAIVCSDVQTFNKDSIFYSINREKVCSFIYIDTDVMMLFSNVTVSVLDNNDLASTVDDPAIVVSTSSNADNV